MHITQCMIYDGDGLHVASNGNTEILVPLRSTNSNPKQGV